MVADDVPAVVQPREGVGRHELTIGQDLATDDEGEAGASHHPFFGAAYARRFGMAHDGAPARHDLRSFVQGGLAGMQADQRSGRRPEHVHRGGVAIVEGAIERTVGRRARPRVPRHRIPPGAAAGGVDGAAFDPRNSLVARPRISRHRRSIQPQRTTMSIPKLEFPPFHLPPEAEALRVEVRAVPRRRRCPRSEDRGPLLELEHPVARVQQGAGQARLDRHHLAEAVWRQRAELPRPLRRHRGTAGQRRAGRRALGGRPPVGPAAAALRQRGAAPGRSCRASPRANATSRSA